MRYILAILLFISFSASAQYDSTKVIQQINADGYNYKVLIARDGGMMRIPRDTIRMAMSDSGALAYKSGRVFVWNGRYWGSSGIKTTALPGYLFNITESGQDSVTLSVDSAALRNLIDSLIAAGVDAGGYLGRDSILYLIDSVVTVSGGGGDTTIINSSDSINIIDNSGTSLTRLVSLNQKRVGPPFGREGYITLKSNLSQTYTDLTYHSIVQTNPITGVQGVFRLGGEQGFGFYIKSPDTSGTRFGIGTQYPTAPLHVVGAPRFETDSAQAGYVWTAKDNTGQGEWRVASISSGVTSSQLTDSLNSRFGTIITDSIKIGNSWYYDAKVTLTASQIYTLNSSPVIAITAPGAGYSLTVTSAALVYNAGATPFNLEDNFYVINTTGTIYETTSQIVLSNTVTQNIVMMPVVQAIGSFDENQPISIQGQVDVADGDGTVTIYLSYKKTQL